MKKWLRGGLLLVFLVGMPLQQASAVPITLIMEVIKAGVKKVIEAIDLKVQRLQNQTIWLQNAQKVMENKLHQLRLGEISEWNEKQRDQYRDLFEELWKVKGIISGMRRVGDIALLQKQLVKEYQLAWSQIKDSSVIGFDEKQLMGRGYQSVLEESLKNLNHLTAVMTSFSTQMNDAQRLEMLHLAEDKIRGNLRELRGMNARNLGLVHTRAGFHWDLFRQYYDLN